VVNCFSSQGLSVFLNVLKERPGGKTPEPLNCYGCALSSCWGSRPSYGEVGPSSSPEQSQTAFLSCTGYIQGLPMPGGAIKPFLLHQ